jgi:hypothetical protein
MINNNTLNTTIKKLQVHFLFSYFEEGTSEHIYTSESWIRRIIAASFLLTKILQVLMLEQTVRTAL